MMLDVIMFFPSSFENYAWNKVMWLSAKFYKERQVMVNLACQFEWFWQQLESRISVQVCYGIPWNNSLMETLFQSGQSLQVMAQI